MSLHCNMNPRLSFQAWRARHEHLTQRMRCCGVTASYPSCRWRRDSSGWTTLSSITHLRLPLLHIVWRSRMRSPPCPPPVLFSPLHCSMVVVAESASSPLTRFLSLKNLSPNYQVSPSVQLPRMEKWSSKLEVRSQQKRPPARVTFPSVCSGSDPWWVRGRRKITSSSNLLRWVQRPTPGRQESWSITDCLQSLLRSQARASTCCLPPDQRTTSPLNYAEWMQTTEWVFICHTEMNSES